MDRSRRWLPFLLCAFLFAPVLLATAQTPKTVQRAKWPEFDPRSTQNVFFDDVFSRLQGERPTNLTVTPQRAATPGGTAAAIPGPAGTAPAAGAADSGVTGAWAAIISAATIEDEIKAMKIVIDESVTTPAKFAGNDYKVARRTFTMLAMLFGIISEYDGDVRWKSDAAAARDLFAQSAANAKVGTIQVYNEAKLRKDDLEDLVGGASLSGRTGSTDYDWGQLVDRSPLMQRLESSMQARLQPWTSNKAEFTQRNEDIFREAELVAAMSEALAKDGMVDADDETYVEFLQAMKQGARDVVDAVKLNNDEQARAGIAAINKACSECHESYR